jgi:hypothetical protein
MGVHVVTKSDDTPVEELPGILAFQFDDFDFVSLSDVTALITPHLVREFDEEAQYLRETIKSELNIGNQLIAIEISPSNQLVDLLGYLPAIRVEVDFPPNQGLASGSGLLVFLEDEWTAQQAEPQVKMFVKFAIEMLSKMKLMNSS